MTRLFPCPCASDYQDARYGQGLRVHNRGKEQNGICLWSCTVCGAKRPAAEGAGTSPTRGVQ